MVLPREPDQQVVGEAVNGREAVELCRRFGTNLVVMNVQMPEMDGPAATHEVKTELSEAAVLVLTAHDDPDYMLEAVRARAVGFVLKRNVLLRLAEVIRTVLRGYPPLDQDFTLRLLLRLSDVYGPTGHDVEARAPRAGRTCQRRGSARSGGTSPWGARTARLGRSWCLAWPP